MDVTEDKNIITEEPGIAIRIIAAIIEGILAVIGGILSAIKNLAEWIYCEIEWDSIKKALVFVLAVSIPACLSTIRNEIIHIVNQCASSTQRTMQRNVFKNAKDINVLSKEE